MFIPPQGIHVTAQKATSLNLLLVSKPEKSSIIGIFNQIHVGGKASLQTTLQDEVFKAATVTVNFPNHNFLSPRYRPLNLFKLFDGLI